MAEFATSVASKLVSKLGEYLFAPIGRQFGYVLSYKIYVQDLKNGVEKLENARERVQRSVDEAMYDRKPIHTDIKNWLDSAENKANEAQKLLKQDESAKNTCLCGWLPNPLVCHPIGRKVKKMTQVIQELHNESANNNFQKVYYENPPIGIVTATTSSARSFDKKEDVLESRASITEDIIKAITDDKISVVGLYGPGGVGKSKLLEDVERQVKKEKLFDVVAMANVSRNPDLKIIQLEISDALGTKLMNVETTRGRAHGLRERLECDHEKKILIILDNLWKKVELKDVGIPCGDDNKVRGCKLLLSSRNREVLRVDMFADREFRLKELDDGEARRLFERILGKRVYDPEFGPLIDGVVKNCGGLPLFIISLAKRLRSGNLAEWRNALTIEGSDLKSLVKLNYKDLGDERIQSLFLVYALSLWGKVDILVFCLGLGLYNNFSKTIKDARDRLNMDLDCLRDSSLLLDSDDSSEKEIDSDQFVKVRMHDIVADVAISIASTKWKALVWREDCGFKKWSKTELRECTAISFPNIAIDELPEKLDCPNLRMLLLFGGNPSLKISKSFFESLEKLQVLELVRISVTSLPSSIEFLENLKSLSLVNCHLKDVTLLGKLKALQILHLVGSTIARLPKEIGELTELRLLNLSMCTRLKVIEPGVLGNLVNLEELLMEDSFDQWEAEDEALRRNASLTELKNMNKLSTLYIAIPHSANLPRDLPFGKLNKHKIQIGGFWDWSVEFKESRTLELKLDSGILLQEWVQRCLQRTQHLHLDGLQDGNDNIYDLCVEGFRELKHLHVQNSPSFHYVVPPMNNVQCIAFTRLVSLFLKNLENFKKICCGCLALGSFSKLKIVKVDNCGEIKHLFPLSMTRIISQLEEIEISRCHSMQQIVADAEVDGDEIYDPNVKPCNLHRLTLQDLPEMTNFYKTSNLSIDFFDGQQLMQLQSVEAITIERCQLIREVFDLEGQTSNGEVEILSQLRALTLSNLPSLGRIWNKNPRRTLCFRNLRALKVQNCENLRFLFSSSMAKALGQIKEIEIASCKLMEEIIDVQEEVSEEAATTGTLEFPWLTSLSLGELPNLKAFSYEKCIHCPSLTKLMISGCPKMTSFFSFKGKQQSMTADIDLQQAFDRINSNLSLPGFFNEKVIFPSLEELKLSSMCQLKRIWHNQLHGQSFCKLASLTVELWENLSHVFPSNLMDRMQSLNKIEVVGCPSLEALFDPICLSSDERQKPLVLSSLEKMKLLNLPRLRDILKSDCKVILAFPSLMEVNVRSCHSLRYLFSSATARTLHKLAGLDVSCCNNMKVIIAMEEGKGKTVETFRFRNLSTLKLGDLENLICFGSESCVDDGLHPMFDEKLAFPTLEELHIKGVQQKELWNDKIHVESFCRLKVLKVKQCHNLMNVIPSSMWKELLHSMKSLTVEKCQCLRNLFTMSMAKSVGQLQYLGLSGCGEMEYIVIEEEEKPDEAVDKIVISQLVTLYLHNMPKLRSFCQGKHFSEWPSLKEFTIEDCKAVKLILGDADCRKLEGSIPTQQPLLLVEKVEFPSMELMKISYMDNMEKIWLDELASTAFSKLKRLIVEHCEKLSSIFSSNTILWSGHPCATLTFERLLCLEVENCKSLKSLFPVSIAKSMIQLEELSVRDCRLEEIIREEDGVGMNAGDLFFPRLTSLKLIELPELRSFYRNSHTLTWPLLKIVLVGHCGKMKTFSIAGGFQSCQGTTTGENQLALFSFEKVIPNLETLSLTREDVAMLPQHYIFGNLRWLVLGCYHDENIAFPSDFLLQGFPNLKGLVVYCNSFEEIFSEDALGHGGATPRGGLTNAEKPLKSLGKMKQLWLMKLCNLRVVWKDGSLMAEILKQIECLFLFQCPSLSIVFPSLASFQRLMILKVEECAGLIHMGTCSAMISLVLLTRLVLRDCGAMEDVVTDDGDGVEEILFPKLEELILNRLPSLESFSPMICAFRFPSLKRIVITQCPKMNIFCKGALRTPYLDKVLLSKEDDEGCWEGDLNTTIRTLST